jgi:hypothetical protein
VTPSVDASPAAGESPAAIPSIGPVTAPRTSPRSTPSTSTVRPSPSAPPTYAPLAVTAAAFHAGEVRIAYAGVALGATGGKSPYTWSIGSGALPDGLALSGNTVGGTPTLAGSFAFSVKVADARGVSASRSITVNIANYLSGNGICVSVCSVEDLCVTVCGDYANPSGGVGPFTFSLASGAIPTGTLLGWPALGGQFNVVGSYTFTVSVVDSLGAKTSVTANFDVFPHITMRVPALPTGQVGVAYGPVIMPYSGGSGVPKVSVPKGSLPPGLSVTVDGAKASVILAGMPTTNGTFSFYIRITDSSPCGVGYNCSFTTKLLTIAVG